MFYCFEKLTLKNQYIMFQKWTVIGFMIDNEEKSLGTLLTFLPWMKVNSETRRDCFVLVIQSYCKFICSYCRKHKNIYFSDT